jgi:hypothetical protein
MAHDGGGEAADAHRQMILALLPLAAARGQLGALRAFFCVALVKSIF